MENQFEGLKVEAPNIAAMTEDKRYATIIAMPRYEEIPDLNDPTTKIRKLIMQVELSNGSKADYYPNKTSGKKIAGTLGTDMAKWIGSKITWDCLKQMVGKEMRDVLYIKDVVKIV